MEGCLFFLLVIPCLVVAIVALVKVGSLRKELDAWSGSLRQQIEDLESELRWIRKRMPPEAAKAEAAAVASEPPPVAPPPPPPPKVFVEPLPPIVEPLPPTVEPLPPTVESLPEPVAAFEVELRPPEPAAAAEPQAAFAAEPPPPPPPPSSATPTRPPFDWESLVGVKLFSWIAGIALALAAVFFLKYSVEHGWLRPIIRMIFGLVTGTGLLILCELRMASRYRVTANAMDASGIAILYATLFASYSQWHLLPLPVVFLLMALVTAVAVLLSIRRDSVFIALLGLVGGFATPALLSTGEDQPIGLFSYLLLLNAGLAWVAYKKRWPVLSVLTLIFTTFYQWMWVTQFLSAAKLPLAIAIFLVFPILTVMAFWLGRKQLANQTVFEKTAALSAALPLLFALYGAAVPAYGARFALLFFFLLCVDVGLMVISASRRGPELLHLLGAASTPLAFAIWVAASYRSAAWPWVLAWAAVFVVLYAASEEGLRRLGREMADEGRFAVLAAPTLLFLFAVLAGIEPRAAQPALLFTVLFALLAIVAGFAIRYGDARMYLIGAFFTLAAEAVWSARHLNPERIHAALLLYLVFALFFLGVPFVARRVGRPLRIARGGPFLLYLSLGLLFFLAVGAIANVALLAIALLLLILILGMFAEPDLRRNPVVVAGAILLSWLVLIVWWISADVSLMLIPSLLVIAGFAILIVAAHTLLQRRAESRVGEEAVSSFGDGLYLGLVGHGFLVAMAMRRELSIPPWPLLSVLAVLVLALGVASLYARRPNLHLVSLAAAQLVLLVWEITAKVHPWPSVAFFSTGLLTILAMAWFAISRRPVSQHTEEVQSRFAVAAAVTAILGQFVAIAGAELPGEPLLALAVATHLLLLLALLRLGWIKGWYDLVILATVPTAMAYFLWRGEHYNPQRWAGEMLFATVLYLCFIAYPLVLGARVGRALQPYLAAILASVAYFFFARTSWEWRGLGPYIGLLPVAQAALLALLLGRLLRIEPARERVMSRVALVAAAALAFITVAIPLQLDKEWITIAWALEAAALVWLFRRVPHRGLLAWSAGLFVVVFVRLVFNPAVLSYHPRSTVPIFNWYLYTYLIPAAALFVAARLLPRTEQQPFARKLPPLFSVFGTILLFLLMNIEIADFYSKGQTITFNFSAGLAQDLTYTLGWALFAIGMLIAGIALESRATRIASLALLALSVLKCFLHDLMRLGGLYRVGSLVGLAISLAVVALLLQRFVMVRREAQPS